MMQNINPDFPVGNAAGWCKTVEQVVDLARSPAQFIIMGSITKEERLGNPGNVWNGESLNSLGLNNMGLKKLQEEGPKMVAAAHNAEKPIIMSVAGFEVEDYETLVRIAYELGFDGAELNLGCPNVVDGGKRKTIASFDLPLMRAILQVTTNIKRNNPNFFLSAKVSPMSNPADIVSAAELMSEYYIDAVVTQNTFPNGLLFGANCRPVIDTPDKTGWAGFAGPAIKPMALGQVNQWSKGLREFGAVHIELWGCGAVGTGIDVQDMQLAGASKVQVGTAYFVSGPKVFGDIAEQYLQYL